MFIIVWRSSNESMLISKRWKPKLSDHNLILGQKLGCEFSRGISTKPKFPRPPSPESSALSQSNYIGNAFVLFYFICVCFWIVHGKRLKLMVCDHIYGCWFHEQNERAQRTGIHTTTFWPSTTNYGTHV